MKKVQYYETIDGKHFDSRIEAEEHDFGLRAEPAFQAYREKLAAAEAYPALKKVLDDLYAEIKE